MSEPQVWTLIGVFAAALFGVWALMASMFVRVIRSEIGGVRAEIGGLRAEMNARFEAVDRRFDYLERDVQALTRRAFGEQS